MSEQATTTTPDPEFFVPTEQEGVLGGEKVRGEVPGCPTGLARLGQAESTQRPGGGGAPTTGTAVPAPSGDERK